MPTQTPTRRPELCAYASFAPVWTVPQLRFAGVQSDGAILPCGPRRPTLRRRACTIPYGRWMIPAIRSCGVVPVVPVEQVISPVRRALAVGVRLSYGFRPTAA